MIGIKQGIKANPILVAIHLSYIDVLLLAFLSAKGLIFVLAMEPDPKGCTRALRVAHMCSWQQLC